jgi:hypothetical protein
MDSDISNVLYIYKHYGKNVVVVLV